MAPKRTNEECSLHDTYSREDHRANNGPIEHARRFCALRFMAHDLMRLETYARSCRIEYIGRTNDQGRRFSLILGASELATKITRVQLFMHAESSCILNKVKVNKPYVALYRRKNS